MNKIIEALKKLLPEDQLKEVASAVEEMFVESTKEIEEAKEKEFNEKLEEAYATLAQEMEEAEKVALQGYQEAFSIITDQNNREQMLKKEFEKELEEGFEEAYQMIESEKAKSNSLSMEIYEEYDQKLSDMKEYIVDKLDEFLHQKGAEIYEQAKRDVVNDPRMAEHKVAMAKITDIVGRYLSDEEFAMATSTKLEESFRKIEELQGQMKMMEGRNINLSRENSKLNEEVRRAAQMINESTNHTRKERAEKAKNVSGRGQKRMPAKGEEQIIIKEDTQQTENVHEADNTLIEHLGIDRESLNVLAGVTKPE